MSRSSKHGCCGNAGANHWWQRILRFLGLAKVSVSPEKIDIGEELRIAYQASSDGDLAHAALHISRVLHDRPAETQALTLLDRLAEKQEAAGNDVLDLAPLEESGMYAGTAGMRAYLLARLNRYPEAMGLLRQIDHALPEAGWWRWAADWLREPAVATKVNPDHAVGILAGVANGHDGDVVTDPAAIEELETILPAIEQTSRAHANHEMAVYLHVMTLRKLGRLEEARQLADGRWASKPTYFIAIARAMVKKAQRDVEGSAAAFEDAVRLEPGDPSARADLAELLAGAGRFEEALHWAEEAKRHDAAMETSSWPLSYLLRHRIEGRDDWLEKLEQFEREHPNARQPGPEARMRLGAFVSYLPGAAEATINVLRELHGDDRLPAGGSVKFTVSNLESPSSFLTVQHVLGRKGIRVDFTIQNVPSPDPRLPRADLDWLLWRYEGTIPEPGLPDPIPTVIQAAVQLARQPFDLQEWTVRAKESARALVAHTGDQPDALHRLAGNLLAVMVHPPAEPEGQNLWDWVRRLQVAAALLVASIDRGWESSIRRRAILAIIRGPVDWTTEAGILALSQVDNEPDLGEAAHQEILLLFRELIENLPDAGHCCYLHPLAWAISRISEERKRPPEAFAPLWERLQE